MAKRRKSEPAPEPVVRADESSDEITLDLGAIKQGFSNVASWFGRWDMNRAALVGLLILAFALTLWIRLQPITLGVTNDWAETSIRQNLNAQFSQQVNQQFPNLPATNRDALVTQKVDEFIAQNPTAYEDAKKQISVQLKEQLQYQGENGKTYTYLGDIDSYFWLRYTRNWLNNGTTCDSITTDGKCRDTYVLAPVGVPSSTNPSFHVFAIGWVHLFLTLFDPHMPLTATSLYSQMFFGLLCIIPAFFIGRRIAGNVGGFVAAVVIALNPMYLSRSLGNDNDHWNILWPLMAAWLMIEALEAKNWKRTSAYAAGAAVMVGLHAASWAGWWMPYLVIFFGAIGLLMFRSVRDLVRGQRKPWNDKSVRLVALAIGVFYLGSLLTSMPNMTTADYLQIPLDAMRAGGSLDSAVAQEYWPNVLTTVAELNKSNLAGAINNFGGPLLFLAALTGILLLLLPRKNWRLAHYVALAGGIALYAYLVNATTIGKWGSILLLGVPVLFALILDLVWGVDEDDMHLGAALIVLVWFLASTYATYSGVRFIVIMVPAFGIAFGALIGRLHDWGTRILTREFPKSAVVVSILVFLALSLVLIQPVKAGYATAHGYIPTVDDAWWGSLTKIRDETPKDAIINSWWDFGHWFKYIAERRVSADGTTQHTHVPHWLGRSLVTPNEREAVGILRMLDCGSDAYPQEEGKDGAYGITLSVVKDPMTARNLVSTLTKQNRTAAQVTLTAAGVDSATAQRILAKTHCEPPADYFVTSNDMIGKAGVWAHFGLWDFDRAFVAQTVQDQPQETAVSMIVQKLNVTQADARALYLEVQQLHNPDGSWNEGGINQWVAPWPGYLTGSWITCSRTENGTAIDCPGGFGISQQAGQTIALDAFRYNITSPQSSVVLLGVYANGQRVGQQGNATPEAIIVADDRLRKLGFSDATLPGIAIVVDVPNNRMLVASTPLAESMFTQLYYLDGRYNKIFKKFDDRTGGVTGSHIIVWQVDWAAIDAQALR